MPRVNPALRRRRISNGLDSVTVLPEAELLHLAAYFFKSGLHSRENCGIIRPVKAMTGTSTAGGTYREQPGDERRRGSRAGNTSPSFAPNGRQVGCDGTHRGRDRERPVNKGGNTRFYARPLGMRDGAFFMLQKAFLRGSCCRAPWEEGIKNIGERRTKQ